MRSAGRLQTPTTTGARPFPGSAGHGAAGADGDSRALRHLQRLYEISTLLTRFDGIGKTVGAVIATAARTLDLRSAIFILETDDHPQSVVWQATGQSPDQLDAAKAHADRAYRYLSGASVVYDADHAPKVLPAVAVPELDDPTKLILLPLLVDRGPIFGALQLEGLTRLDELDLVFANAVTNQLAIALARHASVEGRLFRADAARDTAQLAELTLRGKFDLVRDVTAALGEGVIAVDLAGRITLFNPAAEAILGIAAEHAMGQALEDLLHVWRNGSSHLSVEEFPLTTALHADHVFRSDEHLFSTRGRLAFPVSFTAAPFRHEGKVRGAVLAFLDIIELKRAESEQRFLSGVSAALSASLEHRETLAAVARVAVPEFADLCFIDELFDDGTVERGHVVFASATRQQQLAGRVAAFAPLPGRHTPQRQVLESRRALRIAELGADQIAPDDDHALLMREIGATSMIVVPLTVRDQPLGVISFIAAESGRRYTVLDLALAEEVARRTAIAIDNARTYTISQRAILSRDNLLATVSHDLRSPLNAILLSVEALTRTSDPARISKRVESIGRAALRMSQQIADLLDTASIEAGHLSLALAPVRLAPILADVLDALDPQAAAAGISLVSTVAGDLPEIYADAHRIGQVFSNLVGNAIKFTPRGGAIRIAAEVTGDAVQVSVVDTGAGIAAEALPHVFDRFWKAPRAAHGGTGLGLFIVRGIVEAHRGRVWIDSTIGLGTQCCLTLPVAPAA